MNTRRPRYLRHRFPPEIISHAVRCRNSADSVPRRLSASAATHSQRADYPRPKFGTPRDHRRWSSSQDSWWANGRGAARVQHPKYDDRHGPARLLRHRPVKHRGSGRWRVSFDSCTNACAGKARSRGTRCRDVIFETLFDTLWVSNPIRPRSAASRNRVMRGPGVTPGAKRSQGARRPRD